MRQQFQLTAARRRLVILTHGPFNQPSVSTHSRPKAAGKLSSHSGQYSIGFNSQPPEGGWLRSCTPLTSVMLFQLTAARRRLVTEHSAKVLQSSFNSQPPEGGWRLMTIRGRLTNRFQLTAARRRLGLSVDGRSSNLKFQLTAARRRLAIASYK